MKEISYQYTPEIEKKLIYTKLWHSIKYEALIFVLAIVAYVISSFNNLVLVSLCIKMFLLFFGIGFIGWATLFFVRSKNFSMKLWQNVENRTVKIQFTEENIKMSTEVISSEVAWNLVRKVTRSKNFWFLWIGGNQCFSIPVSCIDSELKQLINLHVKQI